MDTGLLATKVRVPPHPHRAVHRTRLLDMLEREAHHHKLILLSAPAGYGKTTLLTQWAHASRYPVAWLSLSEEDNDPERFLRYLFRAWEAVQPGVAESPLGWLLNSMFPDRDAVLSAFINLADETGDHVVFALDDYHVITEPSIHTALTYLLDNLPPSLHVILGGRADPPLPLSRYRGRGELLELRVEDLRFQPDEANEFLTSSMDLDLPQEQIASIHEQLEGWATGLQLVALGMRRTGNHSPAPGLSGRHRYIADYLTENVLAGLSEDIRRFLLQSSILDRLHGDLCDAVTEQSNSQEMLETLERENLFLMALDDSREWYRYHRLFADVLREELQRRFPDDVDLLHSRASKWYLDHDLPERAFRHAIDGGDIELAVKIFDRYANAKLNGGELRVVSDWLSLLPEEWYVAYPAFNLARAGLLGFSGDMNGCIRCVEEIEKQLATQDSESAKWQMARVHAVRCFIACMRNDIAAAEDLADLALRGLSEDDLGFRPVIYGALGDVYRHNGRWENAYASYRKVLGYTNSPSVRLQAAHVYGALADLELRQGRLKDAAANWRKALSALEGGERTSRLPLPVVGWIYIRLAEVLYEWDQLAESRSYVTSGLNRVELGGDVRSMIAGYILAGRLDLAEGNPESASAYLERARPLVEQSEFHEWVNRFERYQLELWLAQDRLRAAVHWSDSMLEDEEVQSRPESEIAQLAMARVLVVKGDRPSVERALTLLERTIQMADSEGRNAVLIESLALRSLARSRLGDQTEAMADLERALRLAEPEGYLRLFVDLGLPMARLLQEARARRMMPEVTERLLATFGSALPADADAALRLAEPLTERETEIVGLLAAGLTNSEIGERLFISPQTVKKHTTNIYGKLGVRRRTEAVARARALDLLS